MEVYTALYDEELNTVKSISAEIIDENSFSEELSKSKIVFFGNGADKCKSIITHPNAIFLPDIYPLAKNMLPLSKEKFLHRNFEDVAYFEPFYLKDFVATTPTRKLL
jgi:tRNA threonylcarbamoyladenosine biosynthesis protein TsaB